MIWPWNQHKNVSLTLHPHQIQKLDDVKPGMTVVCDTGVVWLTESDNPQDYTMRPGHSVVIKRQGQVLIEAVEAANVSIHYPN